MVSQVRDRRDRREGREGKREENTAVIPSVVSTPTSSTAVCVYIGHLFVAAGGRAGGPGPSREHDRPDGGEMTRTECGQFYELQVPLLRVRLPSPQICAWFYSTPFCRRFGQVPAFDQVIPPFFPVCTKPKTPQHS